jgi:hypothetical protein
VSALWPEGLSDEQGCPSIFGTRLDDMRGGRFGFTQSPESSYHDARPGTISNIAQVPGVKPRELLKTKLQGDRD